MKKLLLFFVSMLLLTFICMHAVAAVNYDVIKPSGFDSSMQRYPVVYIMPEDGYINSKTNPMAVKLREAMSEGKGMNMLLVLPSFEQGSNLHEEMAWLVNEIDTKAFAGKTVQDSRFRAVVGSGVGGYMAYAAGMLNSAGTVEKEPQLFSFVGSVRGWFAQEENPWYEDYDSIYDKLSKAGGKVLANYFTYMDTPVDDPMSNVKGSTNDLGYMFIQLGTGADKHEYTSRPGTYTAEFVKESASRIANRFTNWMLGGSFMTSLSSVVVTSADSSVDVAYSVMPLGFSFGTFDQFDPYYAGVESDITLSVLDSNSGKVLTSASVSPAPTLRALTPVAGSLNIKNVTKGKTCQMKLTVSAFGTSFDVATANLVCIEDPIFDGENQKIDLMGEWYFKYTGFAPDSYLDIPALTASKEYRSWSVVQPALGNWDNGYGNIDGTTVDADPNSGYFNMMITGNGYYARDFVLPDAFDTKKPIISVGCVDDRCEVYLNGHRIGGTGIAQDGSITDETETWSVHSYFAVDPDILNYGGENTIVVRAWNNLGLGAGGWYAGPVAIYSEEEFNNQGGSYTDRFFEATYYSKAIGKEMEYLIYLPKNYSKTDRYYPTMYLLHQFSSDHTSYLTDSIHEVLDKAIDKGLLDEMIVVIPNSSGSSFWKGEWEDMVINDLIPYIDENYRTVDDARYRFTAGCSMGGQGAASVALTNPDYFSGYASFFGAFSGSGYSYGMGDYLGKINPVTLAKKESVEYLKGFAHAFICGNQDSYGFGVGKIELHQLLENKGVDHFFFIENGGHDSTFYVPNFAETLSKVWNNMYDETELKDQEPDLRKMAYASLIEDEGKLVPMFVIDEEIEEYYHLIPGSSYTKNPTPALNIPLRITITQNGKQYRVLLRNHKLEQGANVNVLPALTAEDFVQMARSASGFDPQKKYDYKIEAAMFDNNWVTLQRVPAEYLGAVDLPNTGDASNMALYVLLLTASAAALGVLLLRRRCA